MRSIIREMFLRIMQNAGLPACKIAKGSNKDYTGFEPYWVPQNNEGREWNTPKEQRIYSAIDRVWAITPDTCYEITSMLMRREYWWGEGCNPIDNAGHSFARTFAEKAEELKDVIGLVICRKKGDQEYWSAYKIDITAIIKEYNERESVRWADKSWIAPLISQAGYNPSDVEIMQELRPDFVAADDCGHSWADCSEHYDFLWAISPTGITKMGDIEKNWYFSDNGKQKSSDGENLAQYFTRHPELHDTVAILLVSKTTEQGDVGYEWSYRLHSFNAQKCVENTQTQTNEKLIEFERQLELA